MTRTTMLIADVMTRSPHSIGVDQAMSKAHEIMREHRIRHLPVLDGGELVGIVTIRDLHLVETLRDVEPAEVPVGDAMSTEIYAVGPNAALGPVVAALADKKIGSAVVMEGDRVVGLFTTTDALRVLADLLGGPS